MLKNTYETSNPGIYPELLITNITILVLISVVIMLLYLKKKYAKDAELLDKYAVKTVGVIYKYNIHDHDQRSRNYVCYEFTTKNDIEVLSTWLIDGNALEAQYPTGTKIEIEYLPDAPTVNRPIFAKMIK